jgi:hypothetical protein
MISKFTVPLSICTLVAIGAPPQSLSQEHSSIGESHPAKTTAQKEKSIAGTMAAQEQGLSHWMHGIETVGLSCLVSDHAAEVISSEHLNGLAASELKKIGLDVVGSKVAIREMKPFLSIGVIRMPGSGNAEWRVQMRLHDRALRTDRRTSAPVIVWEFTDEDVASGALHDPHKIESTVMTGLRYFEAGVQESRKGSKQPVK